MMGTENNKDRIDGKDINGGPIPGQLESDNAFSDKGLANHEATTKAMKQKNSKRLFD